MAVEVFFPKVTIRVAGMEYLLPSWPQLHLGRFVLIERCASDMTPIRGVLDNTRNICCKDSWPFLQHLG
jgi:hypothetical protein